MKTTAALLFLLLPACLLFSGAFAGEPEVMKPKIEVSTVYPNPPSTRAVWDKGVLGKDTPWYWDYPPVRRASLTPLFAPASGDETPGSPKDGFTRTNGKTNPLVSGQICHWLIYQNNQVHVGDRPIANLRILAASDMYGQWDTFPITGIGKDVVFKRGTASISLGAIRFAAEANGKAKWLDLFPQIQVTYRAGEAEWQCSDPEMGVDLLVKIRPTISARGMIAQVVAKTAPNKAKLTAFYGCLGLSCWPYNNFSYKSVPAAITDNTPAVIQLSENGGRLNCSTLPRALAFFGVDGPGAKSSLAPENVFDVDNEKILPGGDAATSAGRQCVRVDWDLKAGKATNAIAVWGADGYDETKMQEVKKRFPAEALAEPEYSKVWKVWFDNFIGDQLEPEAKFKKLTADPQKAWAEAEGFWKDRARRWTVQTPDDSLNGSVNWDGQTLEYFRQPPGYMLGQLMWCGFGHMTSGWNALGAMGDDMNLEMMLGMHAGTRDKVSKSGEDWKANAAGREIKWIFLDLNGTVSEPMNAPWLHHVWMWWQWTGNTEALRALWPAVRDAIAGEMAARDPDGDGLYHGFYEFWDCDREQRGPKAAGETAWMINSLRGAAKMAEALGYKDEVQYYKDQAEKSVKAWQAQLWYPEIGQCGARSVDDQRYERTSIHEAFLPILKGVTTDKQGAQVMRRLQYLYGQTSRFGNPLMFKNDCWPIFWSQHYMPPGDISLAYIGAAKCGLADEYFPYYELISHAPFKSYHAGFGLAIGQDGATDAQQIGNMDAQAPFAWAAAEGLFGISPDGEPGHVLIAPNIPEKWNDASGAFGEIKVEMTRKANAVKLAVTDNKHRLLRIQWPTKKPVTGVKANGRNADYTLVTGINRALVEMTIEAKKPLQIEYAFGPDAVEAVGMPAEVVAGTAYEMKAKGGKIVELDDPQKCLKDGKIASDGASMTLVPQVKGFHTIFAKVQAKDQPLSYWSAVSFETDDAWKIVDDFQTPDVPRSAPIKQLWPKLDCATKTMLVRIVNRQGAALKDKARVTVAGEVTERDVDIAPGQTQDLEIPISAEGWKRLLPGSVGIEVSMAGLTQKSKVVLWPIDANPGAPQAPAADQLVLLDIDSARNLTYKGMETTDMPIDFTPPPGADKLLGWYNFKFVMNAMPPRFEPVKGLPMAMSALAQKPEGEPMLVIAHGGTKDKPIPTRARFDIGRKIQRAYVLTVFNYYTIKCYAPQAEWILTYDDGSTEVVSWVPPYDINGHQRPESPWSLPVTAVGQFPEDHSKAGDHAFGPFHAQLVDIVVNPAKTLKSMEARQTQTESFNAILGITLVKAP